MFTTGTGSQTYHCECRPCNCYVKSTCCVAARSRAQERAEAETGPWTPALQEELGAVSDERDALRAQMADLRQQAAGINCANPRVMQARPRWA